MSDILFEVTENTKVVEGVYRLRLHSETKIPDVTAGQFLHLEVPNKSMILRRPFCIYDSSEYDATIYYAVVGKGTGELAVTKTGTKLKAIIPLGNGFDISAYKRIGLLGGGLGCAELYSVSKTADKEFYAYLGFANKDRIMFTEDFQRTTKKLTVCTYDGSFGTKGAPLDFLLQDIDNLDAVLLCGSPRLVKETAEATKDLDIPVFVSVEQRMGCGVGACLVCACAIKEGGETKFKRACMDGPIFNLKDVVL